MHGKCAKCMNIFVDGKTLAIIPFANAATKRPIDTDHANMFNNYITFSCSQFCKNFRVGEHCCEFECLDPPGEDNMYQVGSVFRIPQVGIYAWHNLPFALTHTRVDDLSLQWRLKKKAEILAGNAASSRHRRSDRKQMLTLLLTTIVGACISIAMSLPSLTSSAFTAERRS